MGGRSPRFGRPLLMGHFAGGYFPRYPDCDEIFSSVAALAFSGFVSRPNRLLDAAFHPDRNEPITR